MSWLANAVGTVTGAEVASVRPVGGGCISDAQRAELVDGRVVFVKPGQGMPEGLLEVEAEGLRWLGEPSAIGIPRVLGLGGDPGEPERQVLVLEWIESGARRAETPRLLGTGLARLHAAGAPAIGWHRDGFIGSLPQPNTPSSTGDWAEFWFTRRIRPLARRATDSGGLDAAAGRLVDRLGDRLADRVGPPEPPARVHGDLWSGNVMVGRDGAPWLVDPAAYGGHREVDLAMLHLFGDPGPAFLDAYQEVAPLAAGWEERLRLWQLEPLLVHTVLFGGGYGAQAQAVLAQFA